MSDILIKKPSPHNVAETINRLEKAIQNAGAKVFARINHAAGAESVGTELNAAEVLIFGNPKIGTGIMKANPIAGLDLPLRALAYQDDKGSTWLVYSNANRFVQDHGIDVQLEPLKQMANALDKLSDAAIAP